MYRKLFSSFILMCSLVLLILFPSQGNTSSNILHDASWQKTFQLYRKIPCLTQEEIEYGAEVIAGLGYNASRAFRKIAQMESINFTKSKEAWSALIALGLTFEQVQVFESWSDIENIHVDLALKALVEINSLDYEAGKAFRNYSRLDRISPEHALQIIPLLNRLSDTQNRAVQHLFALPDIRPEEAIDGLGTIALLDYYQTLALEAFEKIPAMSIEKVADAMPIIKLLSMENAWNARTLFSDVSMTPAKAWFWLVAFLANPSNVQEKQFHTFTNKEKEILIRSFYNGGDELIWKINNLHDVTDRFGLEISNQTLLRYSTKAIHNRFENLSPQTKSSFADRFYQTESKNTKIGILKQAIAQERKETALRLTTANIYALLAQGSELYDSSFRNILVPVLKKEIERSYSGSLLTFLEKTDPTNLLVSSFIVSLAQKGKLTAFFPENSREQEHILNLVVQSAFKDENAIILFSATFMHLLEVLEPQARSFLVHRMTRLADEGTSVYSRLITVILQFYLEEFPEMLSKKDHARIVRLVTRHGATNLLDYLTTPFAQWKADGTLSSLSIFHPDDDGSDSFQSNAKILMNSGYKIKFSEQFSVVILDKEARKNARKLIDSAKIKPGVGLPKLFKAMQRHQFAVSFVRAINGLTINHAAYVYTNENDQAQLLERFVLSGTEMLAQRGHSYWRSEQITEPMEKLKEQGRLTEADLRAKQRFLSLGSCGGVKAYTRLNQMFHGHVDILATIGSGLAVINDPYNKSFFEVIAKKSSTITWKDLSQELAFIFKGGHGRDYLQPGSLPAILHKILDEEKNRANQSTSRQNKRNSPKES